MVTGDASDCPKGRKHPISQHCLGKSFGSVVFQRVLVWRKREFEWWWLKECGSGQVNGKSPVRGRGEKEPWGEMKERRQTEGGYQDFGEHGE